MPKQPVSLAGLWLYCARWLQPWRLIRPCQRVGHQVFAQETSFSASLQRFFALAYRQQARVFQRVLHVCSLYSLQNVYSCLSSNNRNRYLVCFYLSFFWSTFMFFFAFFKLATYSPCFTAPQEGAALTAGKYLRISRQRGTSNCWT